MIPTNGRRCEVYRMFLLYIKEPVTSIQQPVPSYYFIQFAGLFDRTRQQRQQHGSGSILCNIILLDSEYLTVFCFVKVLFFCG